MEKIVKNHNFIIALNILGLAGIVFGLALPFYYQIVHSELPCPLCLLQRIGLVFAGLGFLFNLYRGLYFSHYALIIIGSIVTATISVRQIFLHILPECVGYGSTFLGLHFYTLVFLVSVLLIFFVLGIIILSELVDKISKLNSFPEYPKLKKIVAFLFILLIFANIVSSFLECGFYLCPEDPMEYIMLS